jgi:hypothetical protein
MGSLFPCHSSPVPYMLLVEMERNKRGQSPLMVELVYLVSSYEVNKGFEPFILIFEQVYRGQFCQ